MTETLLETAGLCRAFGPLKAVDDVSIAVKAGTITGLIGPNGAGKSTLFNLLTGVLAPDAGKIRLKGEDVTGLPPDALFTRGLGRTFQIPRPFARMSVLENVMMAPVGQTGERVWGPFVGAGRVRAEEARIRARALEVLDFVTLAPLADHPAGKISGGQRKLLELARVLMGDPEVILLDEPAAGVNPSLTATLIEKIEALNRQGKTFVIIEHDMDFIMRHCDPVIAMAEGRLVFEGSAAEAQANPVLLEAYLGTMVHG
ncbi:amino acid/amide ABC transporter ATP-binding protein 1, HAAT family [Roseivivax lentus]|uniref:Amino acid/amide ABC transporter ATP-binding protein 1, HAAT family n=1 Tax=Roseivivax lentus TaxID=633194 RepID=A0A1N7PA25_9RHOB|nr:ABC transporter ATP-binding protein [Roseivivax lentus]SIT07485.1 amino acid/amide ABC transporter ATP-binding protein 1, HAAT family [Roseivivax lentus]